MRQAILFSFSLILFFNSDILAQHPIPNQKKGKWGLENAEKKVLIPFEQDKIRFLADGVYAYWKGDDVRLYNHPKSGEVFLDAGLLKGSKNTLVLANKEGRYGLVNTEGKEILPFDFYAPPKALDELLLLPVKNGNLINFGLYTPFGKKIIPPKYYSIKKWGDKYFKCKTQEGGEALMKLNGKKVIQVKEGEIDWVIDDFIMLSGGGLRTIILRKKKKKFYLRNPQYRGGMMVGYDKDSVFTILPPNGKIMKLKRNQKLMRIEEGKIVICKLDKNQECKKEILLDKEMKELVPPKFDRIVISSGDLVVVQPNKRKEKYSLYRTGEKSKILIENKDRIELYDHGWIRVFEDKEWKFINSDLKPPTLTSKAAAKLPEKYVAVKLRDILRVRQQNKDHFQEEVHAKVNPELIFPLETNEVKNIRDKYNNNPLPDRLVIRTPYQNPWPRSLLIDLNGKILSDFTHNTISWHEEGFIIVYGNDTIDGVRKSVMGLLDMNGKVKIPLIYDEIQHVGKDHIVVKKYGLYGVISYQNEFILPLKYGFVRSVSNYFLINRFGKMGIATKEGEIITQPKYDEIKMMEGEIGFEAKLNKKTIYMDLNGQEVENN